jgi:hypothetical protein
MLLLEVKECKAEIKYIFKSHLSKYNMTWRNTPDKLKLPWVEKIRGAKGKIGKLQREIQTRSVTRLEQAQTFQVKG